MLKMLGRLMTKMAEPNVVCVDRKRLGMKVLVQQYWVASSRPMFIEQGRRCQGPTAAQVDTVSPLGVQRYKMGRS
jgi:hypothetical protein